MTANEPQSDCPHIAVRQTEDGRVFECATCGADLRRGSADEPQFVCGIDPGPTDTAVALIDRNTCRPIYIGKAPNEQIRGWLPTLIELGGHVTVAVEQIASYGMPVGEEVFTTCIWTGRYIERWHPRDVHLVKRGPVKLHHCHSVRATDANVTQALVDRFTPGAPNRGKGTKAAPGWFYGFAGDIWQAYAVAVYTADVGLW